MPMVQQAIEPLEDTDTDNPETLGFYFEVIDAFITGFKLDNFVANGEECIRNVEVLVVELNETYVYWLNKSIEENTYDFISNISGLVSNEFAEAYLYCHLTTYDAYIYYLQ